MRLLVFLSCLTAVFSIDKPAVIEKPLPPVYPILPKPILPVNVIPKTSQRVVCYIGRSTKVRTNIGEMDITDIDQRLCTHVILSSISIDMNGKITIQNIKEEQISTLMKNLKILRSRNVKILWSWGGWTEHIDTLNKMIRSHETRTLVVNRIFDWILTNEWDGLDLDWAYHYVVPIDIESQLLLLNDLKISFKDHKFSLTMAVSSDLKVMKSCYEILRMIVHLDWINVRAYDVNCKKCSLLAPLYVKQNKEVIIPSVDMLVQTWLQMGVPPSKLLLGVPMIGIQYKLMDQWNFHPGAEVIGKPKILPYYNVCEILKDDGWQIMWEEEERANWAHKGDLWMSWSSVKSVGEKAKYVKRLGLGGIVAWGIDRDDNKGVCGTKWPLLSSINSVFHQNGFLVTPPIKIPVIEEGLKLECNKAGFLADIKDPNRYYQCIIDGNDVTLVEFVCPRGLIFNQVISVCDWPNKK